MATVTGATLHQMARARAAQAKQELLALDHERRNAKHAKAQIDKEHDAAWTALAAALVPKLDTAVLDARAAQLGLPAISAASVKKKYDDFVAKNQRALAELDADDIYARREELDNASQIKIAELDDAIAPLAQSVQLLEDEPMFAELVRLGYDTDGYPNRFWQLSYYRHWKRADEIVARQGPRMKCERFADIRAKYVGERDALAALLDEKRTEQKKRAIIAEKIKARENAAAALREAPERTLASVHSFVQSHLRPVGVDALLSVVAGDAGAELALKRVAGSAKKREYLEALEKQYLDDPDNNLRAFLTKASKMEQKYGRPKNWSRRFDVDVDRVFPDKSQSWAKRRQRFSLGTQNMIAWNEYERARLANDFLWWDLWFDDRWDTSYVPEVAHLRSQNSYLRAELDQERASAAVAQAQLDRDDARLGAMSGDIS